MAKIKDLSPSFGSLQPAEIELQLPAGTAEMGQKIGGIAAFANAFKRGHGDRVFGSDENGIWLGAADFENAPFRVYMNGNVYIRTSTGAIVINAEDGRIEFYEGDVPVGFMGFQTGAF